MIQGLDGIGNHGLGRRSPPSGAKLVTVQVLDGARGGWGLALVDMKKAALVARPKIKDRGTIRGDSLRLCRRS